MTYNSTGGHGQLLVNLAYDSWTFVKYILYTGGENPERKTGKRAIDRLSAFAAHASSFTTVVTCACAWSLCLMVQENFSPALLPCKKGTVPYFSPTLLLVDSWIAYHTQPI
jgi:hypothetical protein